jgi:hypothetical protein
MSGFLIHCRARKLKGHVLFLEGQSFNFGTRAEFSDRFVWVKLDSFKEDSCVLGCDTMAFG